MKPKEPFQRKKRKKKGDEWEIDLESNHPVHEKYTREEPVKEG